MGEIGGVLRVADTDGIRRKLGPRWAYRMRGAVMLASEEDWQIILDSLTAAHGDAA